MKKNYVLWFALWAFFLNSCTWEELVQTPAQNTSSATAFKIKAVNRLSFAQMQAKLLPGTIPPGLKLALPIAGGRSLEEFDIDTTLVKEILYDDSGISYTMRITPKDNAGEETKLYNYNITLNNGETTEKVIKYSLQEDGQVIADESQTEVVYSRDSGGNCTVMIIPCEYGNYHQDGSTCQGHGITIIIKCGSGGNTGGGGNEPPQDGPTTPTGPGGYNPYEGGGNGGNTNNTPCQRLKNILDPIKANAKPLIVNGMYNYINNSSSGEGGINLKKTSAGIVTSEILPYTADNFAPVKTGGNYYSAIHTHPKDTYPMFSWSDVYVLYKLETKGASHNSGQASLLLVCEDDNGVKQTYAITFEDVGLYIEDVMTNPENIGCTDQEIIDNMNLKLEEEYKKEARKTTPDYERAFLKLSNGTNIGLYKANSTLTSWSKLSLSSNFTVTQTNCN